MLYNTYFWGMGLVWWIIWVTLLIWIFVVPYNIPGQRKVKDSPLDILKKRLALGQITNEEYRVKKDILENDITR